MCHRESHMRMIPQFIAVPGLLFVVACSGRPAEIQYPTDPRQWEQVSPAEVGLDGAALDKLAHLVRGHGVVVRHGKLAYAWGDPSRSIDVASACKPVISALLMFALQDGLIDHVDEPVIRYLPELADLPDGKNRTITWLHLASQTSGYGLVEEPGAAWGYNDYALALYYDVLVDRVFDRDGGELLMERLGDPMGWRDPVSFRASQIGRLAVSARDFARFGQLMLNRGTWNGRQILDERHIDRLLTSMVPVDLPRTTGEETPMLPGQRTIGGRGPEGKNLFADGPGHYSFNWWLNEPPGVDRPLFPSAPPDAIIANGRVNRHMLWIIPSLDLVVVWLDSALEGNNERCDRAAALMVSAATGRIDDRIHHF